ncbi:MAG TPA: hypothetical protein VGE62_04185 [Candidatus Paceibacterota bacterium]
MQKKAKNILTVIAVVLLVIIAAYATRHNEAQAPTVSQEITKAPGGLIPTRNTPSGISFNYPESFGTQYVTATDWPPQVRVLDTSYSCADEGSQTGPSGRTEKRIIEGTEHCVTTLSEGAAGSTYTTYSYVFEKDKKTVEISFTARSVQCLNYDEPQATRCQAEQKLFNADDFAASVARSLTLPK